MEQNQKSEIEYKTLSLSPKKSQLTKKFKEKTEQLSQIADKNDPWIVLSLPKRNNVDNLRLKDFTNEKDYYTQLRNETLLLEGIENYINKYNYIN